MTSSTVPINQNQSIEGSAVTSQQSFYPNHLQLFADKWNSQPYHTVLSAPVEANAAGGAVAVDADGSSSNYNVHASVNDGGYSIRTALKISDKNNATNSR